MIFAIPPSVRPPRRVHYGPSLRRPTSAMSVASAPSVHHMHESELQARVRLSLVPGVGPILMRRLLAAFGSAEKLIGAPEARLRLVEGVGPITAEQILAGPPAGAAEREWELIERFGVRLMCIDDADYPPLLRHIHDPPPFLYVLGELLRPDAVALAIVGSRQ